jgi:putative tricarboxylic transport membrane protein
MGKAERISAVIIVAFGGFVMAYSYYSLKLGMMITPGAGFLPFFIGIGLVILGVLWFVQKSMRKGEVCVPLMEDTCATVEGPSKAVDLIAGISRKMLLGLAVLIVYAALFERIGYFLSTLIFMFAWQMLVEKERWQKSLLITAIATITMYTLFHYLLNVPLPNGPWF